MTSVTEENLGTTQVPLTVGEHSHPPIDSLTTLPVYPFIFFFKNMRGFRAVFFGLTAASMIASTLRFYLVFLLSQLVTDATTLTTDSIINYYLPMLFIGGAAKELLDYFTRRYGEAFPQIYSDELTLRFYLSLLRLRAAQLFNVSRERLNALVAKYVGNVQQFLTDWFWGTSRKLIHMVVVVLILYRQSPIILLCNLSYVIVFLGLASRLSRRFAVIARKHAEEQISCSTVQGSLTLNLNTVRRLNSENFFDKTYLHALVKKWQAFLDVRSFHAFRWLVQLNLFNVMYVGTLCFGAYQVIQGELTIGFLVLIKYAFDTLWDLLVYIIEYYTHLIEQREDALLARREFTSIIADTKVDTRPPIQLGAWKELRIADTHITFTPSGAKSEPINIVVPEFQIKHGEKIGIVGPSGSGKTTLLYMLLNLIPFEGNYTLDGNSIIGRELSAGQISLVNNTDPLFALPLRLNLSLGNNRSEEELHRILKGVEAQFFAKDLDSRVGSPDFNLSAGQEQRIRIARGLLQQANLYLLDEPFNAIDESTKQKIIEFIREELRDKTVVLVTHQESELKLVDRVYRFDGNMLRS